VKNFGFTGRYILLILLSLVASNMSVSELQHVYSASIFDSFYSPSSAPYGTPYSGWAAKWWQWLFTFSSAADPRDHYSPEGCAMNQNGPVWFLADGASLRSDNEVEFRDCTIPAGKSIIVQVAGGECDYGYTGPKSNVTKMTAVDDEAVRACIAPGNNNVEVSVTLDGTKLENFTSYRTSDYYWFNITIPSSDNRFDANPGTSRAAVEGWFAFLKPLSIGSHELKITGKSGVTNEFGEATPDSRISNVVYKLHIKP
jgi:hypothetical protein